MKRGKLKFKYMWRNEEMADVEVDFENNKVDQRVYTNKLIYKPFGLVEKPNMENVERFFKRRCFPKERFNCKQLIADLGLQRFDTLEIVKKTHGRQLEDYFWVKFEGEDLEYERDIKLRD